MENQIDNWCFLDTPRSPWGCRCNHAAPCGYREPLLSDDMPKRVLHFLQRANSLQQKVRRPTETVAYLSLPNGRSGIVWIQQVHGFTVTSANADIDEQHSYIFSGRSHKVQIEISDIGQRFVFDHSQCSISDSSGYIDIDYVNGQWVLSSHFWDPIHRVDNICKINKMLDSADHKLDLLEVSR
jgi:hypothetical protein